MKGSVSLYDKVTENLMNIVMIGYYIVPLNKIQLYTSTINSVIQIKYNQSESIYIIIYINILFFFLFIFIVEQFNQSKAQYLNLLSDYPHKSYTSNMCISELIIEIKNYSENDEYMKV